jgi:hypothetical protein
MRIKMYGKKQNVFKSPDTTKLQEVKIDERTKIYIAIGADPEEARDRYIARSLAKGNVVVPVRKPAVAS